MSGERIFLFYNLPGPNWIGGVNYYKSLVERILSEEKLHLVILCSDKECRDFWSSQYSGRERLSVANSHLPWFFAKANRLVRRLSGADFFLNWNLWLFGARLVWLQSFAKVPRLVDSFFWVPDLQHIDLPEFFSSGERRARDRHFKLAILHCSRVVVSSETGKASFQARYGVGDDRKIGVYRFAANLPVGTFGEDLTQTPSKFFYVPNQFWKHKNHQILFDAVHLLGGKIHNLKIVMTGAMLEYRDSTYVDSIQGQLASEGFRGVFEYRGVVPYVEVVRLLRCCHAVINPSFSEGWSTTVQEARVFGKVMLLSDLPVHREQAPGAIFFDPNSPEGLRAAMVASWDREPRLLSEAEIESNDVSLKQQARDDLVRLLHPFRV